MTEAEAALKGSILRSYVVTMRQRNILDTLRETVEPEIRERMDFPPVSSEWVPARITTRLSEHLVAAHGEIYTRAFALDANRTGVFAILRPMIQGAFRIGGATPHTLFSRTQSILRAQIQGYEFSYNETDETAGVLTMVNHGVVESRASVVTWEGGLELVFGLFPGTGTVRAKDVTLSKNISRTVFDVHWRPR